MKRVNDRSRVSSPWQPAVSKPPNRRASHVEVGDGEGVGLDEFAARLDEIAHQGREGFLGEVFVADPHLQQRARLWVERRLPQLVGVHLAEAFVAVDLDPPAAQLHDGFDETGRTDDAVFLVARDKLPRPLIDLAQDGAVAIEAARLARPQQGRVDQPPLLDALAVSPKDEALAGDDFTAPDAVRTAGFVERVEPVGGAVRHLDRAVRVGENARRQCAGDRRLLDDIDVADLADERLHPAALDTRLFQESAKIVVGALPAVMLGEDRVAQRGVDAISFERGVVLQVDRFRIAALQPVKRRLRDVEKALLDQFAHLAEEEGQQQCADMAAIDIRVGHDDDAVIARLRRLEILAADAGAERLNQGADLGRGQHLVEAGALDIEDLALQRQDRLKGAVAALLRGAAGAVALDDEELALGRIALLAIGELARQVGDVERTLAPRQVARLARRLARGGRLDDLADDLLRVGGMLL